MAQMCCRPICAIFFTCRLRSAYVPLTFRAVSNWLRCWLTNTWIYQSTSIWFKCAVGQYGPFPLRAAYVPLTCRLRSVLSPYMIIPIYPYTNILVRAPGQSFWMRLVEAAQTAQMLLGQPSVTHCYKQLRLPLLWLRNEHTHTHTYKHTRKKTKVTRLLIYPCIISSLARKSCRL